MAVVSRLRCALARMVEGDKLGVKSGWEVVDEGLSVGPLGWDGEECIAPIIGSDIVPHSTDGL